MFKLLIVFTLGLIAGAAVVLYCMRMVGELNALEMHEKRFAE